MQVDTARELAQAQEANAALSATLEENQKQWERQQAEWAERFERGDAWHLARIAEERELVRTAAQEKIAGLEATLAQSRQHIAHLNGYLDQSAAAGELRGEVKAMKEEQARLLNELEVARENAEASFRKQAEREGLQVSLDSTQSQTEKPGKPAKKTVVRRAGEGI